MNLDDFPCPVCAAMRRPVGSQEQDGGQESGGAVGSGLKLITHPGTNPEETTGGWGIIWPGLF